MAYYNTKELQEILDLNVKKYNDSAFIPDDPISIPHLFQKKQDIEIAALFAAVFAWGNRKTIIAKSKELLQLMDNTPFDFIMTHQDSDLKKFLSFKHRTFNATDALYFIAWMRQYYHTHDSLESLFLTNEENTKSGIIHFHDKFFSLPYAPARTRKHISSPADGSTCKRINMFLRWMIRKDDKGVDFGLWTHISPAQLIIPIDVHVYRTALQLGLLHEKDKLNWSTAELLTKKLKKFDADDPVKYDFALFSIGIVNKKASRSQSTHRQRG